MNLLTFSRKVRRILYVGPLSFCIFFQIVPVGCAAEAVEIARAGVVLPVILPEGASPERKTLAMELASILGKMCGAEVPVIPGGKGPGIYLGTRDDTPNALDDLAKPEREEEKERYRLRSGEGGLWIVGETELALQNGVYGWLYRLGYRQYFPTDLWEIVPRRPEITENVDEIAAPAFATRDFYQTNRASERAAFLDWQKKNRAVSGFTVTSVGVLRPRAKTYRAHPDWFTKSREPKPIVTKEGFRESILEDAIERLQSDPSLQTVGLSPTDGGGWPESPVGTPSDQMVYLANSLITGLRERGFSQKVAFLAYHQQSPPPTLALEPGGAIVLVATSYSRGGLTTHKLMERWKEKGAEIGVYEYLENGKLTLYLPGRALATNLAAVRDTIAGYYKAGARYYRAEAGAAWAPNGLGYYLAAQTLWNPTSPPEPDALVEEFVTHCFGKAREPMRQFLTLIGGRRPPLLSEDLLAKLYMNLGEALRLEKDGLPRRRILDMASYVRYVELRYRHQSAAGGERQDILAQLNDLMLSLRERLPMFGWHGVTRLLAEQSQRANADALRRGTPLSGPIPKLVTDEDLETMVMEGMVRNRALDFQPIAYSGRLVPMPSIAGNENPGGGNFRVSRSQKLIWLAPTTGAELSLRLSGGWRKIGEKLAVKVSLIPVDDPLADTEGADPIVDRGEVPADNLWHPLTLKAREAGLYYLTINDGFNETEVEWPEGEKVIVPSGPEEHVYLRAAYDAVFLVPAGSGRISGYSETKSGAIRDDLGMIVFEFKTLEAPDYFDVEIAPSSNPRVFRIENAVGKKLLMTVPPYLARNAAELLVPEECLKSSDHANK